MEFLKFLIKIKKILIFSALIYKKVKMLKSVKAE